MKNTDIPMDVSLTIKKEEFYEKIIDNVINRPEGCETSKFPASFTSVRMRIEGLTTENQVGNFRCDKLLLNGDRCGKIIKLGKCHEIIHNLYAVISGISLLQLGLSNEEHLKPWWGPNTAKLLDEYDDYVKFTMEFAGYLYEKFDKKTDKAVIFDAIKRSINAERPVLINFGPYYDWFPITGYDDETGRLYGYDNLQESWDE